MAAVFAGFIATFLAFQTREDINRGKVCTTDSGATGFAILTGLALLALAITFLRKED
jgi:hypothetical protein